MPWEATCYIQNGSHNKYYTIAIMEDNGTYMTTDKNKQQIRSLICDYTDEKDANNLCKCKNGFVSEASDECKYEN